MSIDTANGIGDVGFGMLWNREHLSTRERHMILLTLLAVFGRDRPPLRG